MAEQPQGFARRMMAQKLMTDARADPFSDSRFMSGKMRPSMADIEQPTQASDYVGLFDGLGDALMGDTDVQSSILLPLGRTPEGEIVPAFPQMVQGIAQGVRGMGQTVGRAMQGDPRYVPVDGKLPDSVIDEINNIGLTVGGLGVTGANLLKGSIPEGAIGIFAGQRAKNFPVATQAREKSQEILQEQNRLMGEYEYVSQELTKGRMQLGDDVTDELAQRKNQLMDQMQANSSQLGKLEDGGLAELEKRFAATDEKSFFRQTDLEFDKGLFKLPDNQFRFEIDDRPATIKLDLDDDADALFNEITGDALERVLPRTDMGVTKPLSEFLDHDELFDAYPQLKDYPVKIKFDTSESARGSFNPRTKQIMVNLADMRPLMPGAATTGKTLKKVIKSTLVHEIQHAVQEIEGFARGSNPRVDNADVAVVQAVRSKQDLILANQAGHNTYNLARADLVNLGGAERIAYYEQKSLLDSHQPRLLFNQSNWYKYGDEIRRELLDELGYAYNKRKSPKRELWISAAFAKLAQKERDAMPASARLADSLSLKEIKSQYGKARRLADKNYDAFAKYRNARTSLDQIESSGRYSGNNPDRAMNIYLDSLGEVEPRMVQARAEPFSNRTLFPPAQAEEGLMDNPPPFGLENTLRQQGGFFKD